MKEYLKMADVFFKEVNPDDFSLKTTSVSVYMDDGVSPHEYAAHAINSHDELVVEVERLREALNGAHEWLGDLKASLDKRIQQAQWIESAEE